MKTNYTRYIKINNKYRNHFDYPDFVLKKIHYQKILIKLN